MGTVRSASERFFTPETRGEQALAGFGKLALMAGGTFLSHRQIYGAQWTLKGIVNCALLSGGSVAVANQLGKHSVQISKLEKRVESLAAEDEEERDGLLPAPPAAKYNFWNPQLEQVDPPAPPWQKYQPLGIALQVVPIGSTDRDVVVCARQKCETLFKEIAREKGLPLNFTEWTKETNDDIALNQSHPLGIVVFAKLNDSRVDPQRYTLDGGLQMWGYGRTLILDLGGPVLNKPAQVKESQLGLGNQVGAFSSTAEESLLSSQPSDQLRAAIGRLFDAAIEHGQREKIVQPLTPTS